MQTLPDQTIWNVCLQFWIYNLSLTHRKDVTLNINGGTYSHLLLLSFVVTWEKFHEGVTISTNPKILHDFNWHLVWCVQDPISNGKLLTMVQKLILFLIFFHIMEHKICIWHNLPWWDVLTTPSSMNESPSILSWQSSLVRK